MIESFIIGLLVNLSTEGGKLAIKKLLNSDDLEVQINNAYEKALKRWSVNKEIRRKESFWTKRRLEQLFRYLENPTEETNLDNSTQDLIGYFYEELLKEQTAWNFIQSKQFKTTIVKLNNLEKLLNELKDEKLKPEFVLETLKYNAENQIKRQISSGKYIPNTFIETNKLKDHLRYFVAPFTFYPKIFTETKNLNFSHLNRINSLNGKDQFSFEITGFQENISNFSYNELFQETSRIIKYLGKKYSELEKQETEQYIYIRKIIKQKEAFEFINYKVLLLTDNAGRGKTNLLCDFTENVLLKREIPTIFVNGYELDVTDIGNSIAHRIFPNDNYTFNEIIDVIETHLDKKHLIIIIDGINENTNPRLFSKNLETFIEAILQKDFVKIILSCRSEYLKHNFENIIKTSFSQKIKHIEGLNDKLDENQKKRLLWTYFYYFNIKIDSIDNEIKKILADNFLLLRIFSEVNKNKHLPVVTHIYKTELFNEYYKSKVKEINKRLKENNEFNVRGNFSIPKFIKNIAKFMIYNGKFNNLPLNEIIKDDENKEIYIRFLDENILLRKDLEQQQDSIFGRKEVVNFTFDEFRDFIIAGYLINKLYEQSEKNFKAFIEKHLNEQSPILEGVSIFLYSLSRNKIDKDLSEFIKKQFWYNNAFLKVIFNTPDKEITLSDKEHIQQIFFDDKSTATRILIELNYKRYDTSEYSNLNINLLFDIFDNLTNEQFEELVYPVYNSLDNLLEQLNRILDNLESRHYLLFKHILYFMPISEKVRELYYDFYSKTGNTTFMKDLLNIKSSEIVNKIKQFVKDYDIQL